jgi:hypothetical protein
MHQHEPVAVIDPHAADCTRRSNREAGSQKPDICPDDPASGFWLPASHFATAKMVHLDHSNDRARRYNAPQVKFP